MADDGKFHCPCHGATFDAEGRVIKGPAKRNLQRFQVVGQQEDKLQLASVAASPIPEETIKADYYIFATDVSGVQQLFTRMTGDVETRVRSQVEKLSVADPFAVCRFWLDRTFEWEHSNFTSLSDYNLTDSICLRTYATPECHAERNVV